MNAATSAATSLQLPLSAVHRQYLQDHAITDDVIRDAHVFSAGWPGGPPDETGVWIEFPWADREAGEGTFQARMWPEPEEGLPDGVPKYSWNNGEPGKHVHFAAWRVPAGRGPVIIAEGTKQSLAVASWAPAEYAVYGISGCWNWRNRPELGGTRYHKLERFAGRDVVVILDADAGGNLDVYEAGEKLAAELRLEDAASVSFVRMPGAGKEGIDDYLAAIEPTRRAERMAKLIAAAEAAPAARRPTARKITEAVPETGGLPILVVNGDRRTVITSATEAMRVRWGGTQLFSYGGVMTRLRGTLTEPLDKDAFANWLAETVAMYKYKAPGLASPGSYEAAWPDPTTMGAILSRGGEPDLFPELTRVSQTPFINSAGEVCAKNGYDPLTGTMLVMGNSGMDRLGERHNFLDPSRQDAAEAASFILDRWLGPDGDKRGIAWRDAESRANTLALLLTPFIRGIVPLVPLAVISGLQPGVGKNLLADCISRVITGSDIMPLPWIPDDDEENAKKILSAFREGHSMMCFDEAHVIGGSSLTRAITATTYTDRILGVSKMASYPNNVTWMALGNQVSVLADMGRRAYWIEIYPSVPDPENQPEDVFAHPEIREWTLENRPELVSAALVVLRAWFAAGCPPYSRGTRMGSFERWDAMMSGVLAYAGVPGFLGNLTARRAERDTTGGFWEAHLAWLRDRFGREGFTSLDVRNQGMASGGTWEAPPRLENPADSTFARDLGLAYAKVADRWFGRYRIVREEGVAHRKVARWHVDYRDDGQVPPVPPLPPQGQDLPDLHGRDRRDLSHPNQVPPAVSGQYPPDLGVPNSLQTGGTYSTSENVITEGVEGVEGTLPPEHYVRTRAHAHTHAHTREHARGLPATPSGPSGVQIPFLGFDIETADANDIFRWPRGARGEDGVGYVRLAGVIGPAGNRVLMRPEQLLPVLASTARADGHNILGFDGIALAHHHGLDIHRLAAVAFDTELTARQAKPPRSRESGTSKDKYGLDVVAGEMGLAGKTDELPRLAKLHGGYDHIPPDDAEYQEYLRGDLAATAGVATGLLAWNSTPYVRREHAVAALGAQMTLNGFTVDQGLLAQRYAGEQAKKHDALRQLHERFGLPLSKPVMKGRGAARAEVQEPLESPLNSKVGKAWLEQVFALVPDPPRTSKTQDIATGADVLAAVAARPDCHPQLREMIDLMAIATGARTVYQTATTWLCPDGRVHPRNSFRQASGRWSVLNPGMTVFGKHEGRHVERDVFTADERGWVTISFDLAQVDMRAIAGHSGDPEYIKLFLPGRDAHTEIALRVFGTAARRQDAKARGHGWNYGMGPERMIRDGIDPAMAYGFDHGMKESFPVMCSWREQVRAMGKAGYILDNGFGRRMACDPKWAYTVAPALMGQGGARDIMCEALLRLPAWTWPYMRVMVHDEVVFCCPLELVRELTVAVTQAMTWTWHGPGGSVPILCDINGPGWSWGDINAKCSECGATHGPGYCDLHRELKSISARHELEAVA